MPYAPRPYVLKCQQCKWSKIIKLQSDVIMPGMILNECPECGSKKLKRERVALSDIIVPFLKPGEAI
jgi:rRNA maturation endonuclease Nob1